MDITYELELLIDSLSLSSLSTLSKIRNRQISLIMKDEEKEESNSNSNSSSSGISEESMSLSSGSNEIKRSLKKQHKTIDLDENTELDSTNLYLYYLAETLLILIMRLRSRIKGEKEKISTNSSSIISDDEIVDKIQSQPIEIPNIDDPFQFIDNLYEQVISNKPKRIDIKFFQPCKDLLLIDLYSSNNNTAALKSTSSTIRECDEYWDIGYTNNLIDWNLEDSMLDHVEMSTDCSSFVNNNNRLSSHQVIDIYEPRISNRIFDYKRLLNKPFEFIMRRKCMFIFPLVLLFLNSRIGRFSLVFTISTPTSARYILYPFIAFSLYDKFTESFSFSVKSVFKNFVNPFLDYCFG